MPVPGIGLAIVNGVTQLGTSIFGYLNSQNQIEISENQADAAAAAAAAAAANAEANLILGVPKGLFYGILAVIGVIIVTLIIVSSRKKK